MTTPFHSRITITVEMNGDVNLHHEGCEKCTCLAIAAGYELNDRFRNIITHALIDLVSSNMSFIMSSKNPITIKRHWN